MALEERLDPDSDFGSSFLSCEGVIPQSREWGRVSGQPPPVCENCRGPAHLLLAQQATEGSGPPPWARSSALRLLPTLAVCRWWQTSSWGGRYVSVVPIFSEQRHLMFSSEYMCDTSRRKRPNIARTKHFLPAIREASCTALFVTWL